MAEHTGVHGFGHGAPVRAGKTETAGLTHTSRDGGAVVGCMAAKGPILIASACMRAGNVGQERYRNNERRFYRHDASSFARANPTTSQSRSISLRFEAARLQIGHLCFDYPVESRPCSRRPMLLDRRRIRGANRFDPRTELAHSACWHANSGSRTARERRRPAELLRRRPRQSLMKPMKAAARAETGEREERPAESTP